MSQRYSESRPNRQKIFSSPGHNNNNPNQMMTLRNDFEQNHKPYNLTNENSLHNSRRQPYSVQQQQQQPFDHHKFEEVEDANHHNQHRQNNYERRDTPAFQTEQSSYNLTEETNGYHNLNHNHNYPATTWDPTHNPYYNSKSFLNEEEDDDDDEDDLQYEDILYNHNHTLPPPEIHDEQDDQHRRPLNQSVSAHNSRVKNEFNKISSRKQQQQQPLPAAASVKSKQPTQNHSQHSSSSPSQNILHTDFHPKDTSTSNSTLQSQRKPFNQNFFLAENDDQVDNKYHQAYNNNNNNNNKNHLQQQQQQQSPISNNSNQQQQQPLPPPLPSKSIKQYKPFQDSQPLKKVSKTQSNLPPQQPPPLSPSYLEQKPNEYEEEEAADNHDDEDDDTDDQKQKLNELAQQVAALQKQINSTAIATALSLKKQSPQPQQNNNPPVQISEAFAKAYQSNPFGKQKELEALLEHLPQEDQKRLLVTLLMSKQKDRSESPKQKQQLQQLPSSLSAFSTLRIQDPSPVATIKRTNPISTSPSQVSRTPSSRSIGTNLPQSAAQQLKQAERLMDDMIKKQEITIKNLQRERSLNKIAKTSPTTDPDSNYETVTNFNPNPSNHRSNNNNHSTHQHHHSAIVSPPKYVKAFDSQAFPSQQYETAQNEQLLKQPRQKWNQQSKQNTSLQERNRSPKKISEVVVKVLPSQPPPTIRQDQINPYHNDEEEDDLADKEAINAIKQRFLSDFESYRQKSSPAGENKQQQQQQQLSQQKQLQQLQRQYLNPPNPFIAERSSSSSKNKQQSEQLDPYNSSSSMNQKPSTKHLKWDIPQKTSTYEIAAAASEAVVASNQVPPSPPKPSFKQPVAPAGSLSFEVHFAEQQEQGTSSLAEMFKAKKRNLAKRKQEEEEQRKYDKSTDAVKRQYSAAPKSKEELAQIRKDLLHQTRISNQSIQQQQQPQSQSDSSYSRPMIPNSSSSSKSNKQYDGYNTTDQSVRNKNSSSQSSYKQIKEPPPELINRLIYGIKAKVDKKDYQKLTMKNYEQLPEIRRKKEEEKKRQEQAERIRVKKQYDEQLRSRLRTTPTRSRPGTAAASPRFPQEGASYKYNHNNDYDYDNY